jgi:hypothetical protein
VDEALAVGDAAFQIRCMTRMSNLLDRGVSVILVTHDVNTVRAFCDRAVWLEHGCVRQIGDPRDVTGRYLQFLLGREAPAAPAGEKRRHRSPPVTAESCGVEPAMAADTLDRFLLRLDGRSDLVRWGSGEVVIEAFAMDNGTPGAAPAFELREQLHIEMVIRADRDVDSSNVGVCFAFRNIKGLDIITYTTWDAGLRFGPPRAGTRTRFRFDVENLLAPGEYALVLVVEDVRGHERHYLDYVENALMFRVAASQLVFSAVLPDVRCRITEMAMPSQ